MSYADAKANELIRFATYARESGVWPVTGGAMDQSPAFLAGESLIRSDRAAWRAKMGLPV